ncbi:hypothetical protein [Streptomyces sp. SID8352]|uniref:hypothetical protein n=1 Tax=Streptomyces sp. SID8352 TaxID=2690338 RepID=UPI001371E82C|nr:hypothetical protein [Streptomyces sp. SID8352]MYU22865.1 hypothetical protein [Streptomyces sp. SID8352]
MDYMKARGFEKLAERGLQPLEDYPGSTRKWWRMRCLTCGAEVRRQYAMLSPCLHGKPLSPTQQAKAAALEAAATERVRAAGWEPAEPFPGSTSAGWDLRCTSCQGISRRLSTPAAVKPCHHPVRPTENTAEQVAELRRQRAEREWLQDVVKHRTGKLQTKNLRALEDYPGEGQLWWVQCKFCSRAWQMPEDNLRACPHKGAGHPGHPPLPEPTKRSKRPATKRTPRA